MTAAWESKGCESCRRQWESGERPPELAINFALHSRLHRCPVCGTFWEQHERFADTIEEQEARRLYPDAFPLKQGEMKEFRPLNELELALDQAQGGRLGVSELMRVLLSSKLAVPSAEEVMADGSGFSPLLFNKNGVQMLACFSDKSRVGEFADMTPYCLMMQGRELLRRMPPGYGLVINPGLAVGFDMTPDGILRIVSETG